MRRISRKLARREERIGLRLRRILLHLVYGRRRMALTRRRTLPRGTRLHFQRLHVAPFHKLPLLQQLAFIPGFVLLGLVLVLHLNELLLQAFLELLDTLALYVLPALPKHAKSSLLAFSSSFRETNQEVSWERDFALR